MSRSTRKEEQRATLAGDGPQGNEELVEYNIFLSDAFGNRSGQLSFARDSTSSVPTNIDGWTNDDSYRQSRHLLTSAGATDASSFADILRESSLARQVDSKTDQPSIIRLIRRRRPEDQELDDAHEPQLPWINIIPPNTKFFLETIQESREEKMQLIETFGEWIVYFFGPKPEVYNYSGTLLNTSNHDWKNEFAINYDNFLRGSKAVEFQATMMLQYDDVIVEGYMLNYQMSQRASEDKSVPFSFNLLVINRSPINPRQLLGARFLRTAPSKAEQMLFNSLQETLDLTQTDRLGDLQTFLVMREYFAGNYVPPSGIISHSTVDNSAETDGSTVPGAKGGLNNDRPTPSSFSPDESAALQVVGVTGTAFAPVVLE